MPCATMQNPGSRACPGAARRTWLSGWSATRGATRLTPRGSAQQVEQREGFRCQKPACQIAGQPCQPSSSCVRSTSIKLFCSGQGRVLSCRGPANVGVAHLACRTHNIISQICYILFSYERCSCCHFVVSRGLLEHWESTQAVVFSETMCN